ncbi:MAG: hypothetical protein LBF78_16025 [Treponema sp.]|jgi:hypothetical protein|nr:hypothetical protein [Treponema sp.]
MATIQMQKGDTLADIFDSPETIAQARREGYSLVNPADIEKIGNDLNLLTKNELLELARQKGIVEKSLALRRKEEIIERIKAAGPEGEKSPDKPEGPEGGKGPENPDAGNVPDTPETGDPDEGSPGETQDDTKEKRGFFGVKK